MIGTLYDVLGIEPSASIEQVRRAYKQKALETHPDKLSAGATAEEKVEAEASFRKVQEACEVLTDSHRRFAYDVRMRIKTSDTSKWRALSDDHVALMKDREEWARKQAEELQLWMAELRQRKQQKQQKSKEEEEKAPEEGDQYDDLELPPEWEERKRKLQERRNRPPQTP